VQVRTIEELLKGKGIEKERENCLERASEPRKERGEGGCTPCNNPQECFAKTLPGVKRRIDLYKKSTITRYREYIAAYTLVRSYLP
jgi:hypothetical protein